MSITIVPPIRTDSFGTMQPRDHVEESCDSEDIVELDKNLRDSLETNGILYYFNKMLLGGTLDNEKFMPDINGYSLIFMMAPDLSGYTIGGSRCDDYSNIAKKFVFLAMDFTPPAVQVDMASVSGSSGGIPFGTKVTKGGQCSITFLDTINIEVFKFHKLWVDYIDKIVKGSLTPQDKYLDPNNASFGSIDYMSSAYVVRLKPVEGSHNNILYVGKAIGIFPLNLPDKEVIGRRDTNELTTLPMTYSCARYVQTTGLDEYSWIQDDFMVDCGNIYM